LDAQAVDVHLTSDRPSIGVAVAVLLDSLAGATVRTALAGAISAGLQDIDTRRDAVAIVGTADRRAWPQRSPSSAGTRPRLLRAAVERAAAA